MRLHEAGPSTGNLRAPSPRDLLTRLACAVYGLAAVALVLGLYHQRAWATRIWPWPDDHLTYIYLGSLAAAIAAPFLWAAWSGELAMLAPAALDGVVVTAGAALYLGALAIRDDLPVGRHALGALVLAPLFAWLFLALRHCPPLDIRRTPPEVRAIMAVLAGIVMLISIGLLARVDHVFPWDLQPRTSTLFGIVYLGVAVYFAWAALHPAWPMTSGQLLGFLAYTAVLVIPYLRLLGDRFADRPASGPDGSYGGYTSASGSGPNVLSLGVFLAVLAFGTGLAIWSLFLHAPTRILPPRRGD